jgi:hypothetical protein
MVARFACSFLLRISIAANVAYSPDACMQGVPMLYPLCALFLLLITVDTKLKLRHIWPIPRRHDMACTQLYLSIVKGMVFVHLAFAIWMFSFFRVFGQITGAAPRSGEASRAAIMRARLRSAVANACSCSSLAKSGAVAAR